MSIILNRYVNIKEIADELDRRGINSGDIGTHSIRKGSATYCSSGSTDCPSLTAVYLRYESAGDILQTLCEAAVLFLLIEYIPNNGKERLDIYSKFFF